MNDPVKPDNDAGMSSDNIELSVNTKELLNRLRSDGSTAIFAMDEGDQTEMAIWAHQIVAKYDAALTAHPMKLKDATTLPASKQDIKIAIKILLAAHVSHGAQSDVDDLKEKFVRLAGFKHISQKDRQQIQMLVDSKDETQEKSEISLMPITNRYMDLILSEQNALIAEISMYIEDLKQ